MKIYCFLIRGRVQGVGYRAFVHQLAEKLQLSGRARNLADGRVEVLLQTSPDMIEDLCVELRRGPSFAKVLDVELSETNLTKLDNFQIS
ncbi:MAG: acylphosphatase [SAR324 cluster bacterium]|nr:acylphosphatase [SAR324 cluster bacterium]